MTPHELLADYAAKNFKFVTWPAIGDAKGPREKDWPRHPKTPADYHEGDRIGLLTGIEIAPGQFLHDTDLDWSPGDHIALALLPPSTFVFGRSSKRVSHCFYTLPEPLPSVRYEDLDKTCLIELRGTKLSGEIGFQTMVPPSVWSKGEKREPLIFMHYGPPTFIESVEFFKRRICLSAVGMILAKNLGTGGFNHEARLAWAGYLLRAGVTIEEMLLMGDAILRYTKNQDSGDIRLVVESTAASLLQDHKKVKGGPTLARYLGNSGKAIITRINEWLGKENDFVRNNDGLILKDHQDNIKRAIQLLGIELSYNEFSERLLIKEGEKTILLNDHVVSNLWLRVDREFRFRPTYVFFEKVLTDLAREHTFHPVKDYLYSLTWDQEPRITSWLVRYGQAEDPLTAPESEGDDRIGYLEAISSIVLIAAVRRVMQPGCKYDEMLVLESEQGLNKSSALRALCPQDEWFSDDLPLTADAKEIIERTLGKWIIEASDLVGGRKADRDQLKSMMSRQIDGPARMAYAHFPLERPRQFIVIGTTNSHEYLADPTGARRFWPVRVSKFDIAGIMRDRDQLWAEAVVRERTGESIRLPERLWEAAGVHQEHRREVDAWEDIIFEQLTLLQPSTTGQISISVEMIWTALGFTDLSRRDRLGARRIAEIMQRFGFVRQSVREGGKVQAGYVKKDAVKTEGKTSAEGVVETLDFSRQEY